MELLLLALIVLLVYVRSRRKARDVMRFGTLAQRRRRFDELQRREPWFV